MTPEPSSRDEPAETLSSASIDESVQRILGEPSKSRDAALEKLWNEHPEHRPQLRSVLEQVDDLDERLKRLCAMETRPPPDIDDPSAVPEWISGYRVFEKLGEGGMGTVYMAEQREPVQRRVALKVVKLGMDSKQVLARFEAERQALARMDHPNIAQVLDAGTTERGQPFFVMELVRGVPITDYCDRQRLSIRERIELFRQVCEGVQHAHQKGVIHRDIKPSNVFVALQENRPIVKIIDFGLARATDTRLGEHTVYTEQGQIVGTPEYMSPEQAEMSGLDIDTRTDVYSLGVLLYELLVDHLPLEAAQLRRAGILEVQRSILETQPPKPSSRLGEGNQRMSAVAENRSTGLRGLIRDVRGDLDWITMKALEKNRQRRYQTPMELVADLDRFLNDEPVLAGPPTVFYRLRKFTWKYRVRLAVAVLLVVAALAVAVATLAMRELQRQDEIVAVAELREQIQRDRLLLKDFEQRADRLGPELAESADSMASWVADVDAWRSSMPDHRRALAGMNGEDDPFLRGELTELVDALHRFESLQLERVRKSLDWARRVRAETVEAFAVEWQETIAAIAGNSRYRGLDLEPQLGLVPLGRDPDSDLFEFWFVRSGDRPERGADGSWRIVKGTGLVLVLLPPGKFIMGSQSDDPDGPNYFEHAPFPERLAFKQGRIAAPSFLMSKYELTQAQWVRLSGMSNPSFTNAEGAAVTWSHPVESLSYDVAVQSLRRHGLDLPTEAQWEYATRAGKATPWWTGAEMSTLNTPVAIVNIADGYTRWPSPHEASEWWPEYYDGFYLHAPVGSFPANPFGLHEVLGNVAELCHPGDDLPPHLLGQISARGGDYVRRATLARAACRKFFASDAAYSSVGIRPCRALDP